MGRKGKRKRIWDRNRNRNRDREKEVAEGFPILFGVV
jgi:hypothetical protein